MLKEELEEIKNNMKLILHDNRAYKAVPYTDWNKIMFALEKLVKNNQSNP